MTLEENIVFHANMPCGICRLIDPNLNKYCDDCSADGCLDTVKQYVEDGNTLITPTDNQLQAANYAWRTKCEQCKENACDLNSLCIKRNGEEHKFNLCYETVMAYLQEVDDETMDR